MTGDRTHQLTSTGSDGYPWGREGGCPGGHGRDRHRGTEPRGGPLPGRPDAGPTARSCGSARAGPGSPRSMPGSSGQPEPVTLVTMESSGHYWMPLASHLRRRDVPVAVVNPLAAKYFAKSRLARTKSDPADARSLAEMAMRDAPPARDPLAGAELRQAARFAMTLVTEQAKVCQRLHPARRARLPRARRAVRRPHLPDRPRGAPDRAHRARGDPPADVDARRRQRRARASTARRGRRPSACRPPQPTRSRSPSSTPRSPSRSASCSTSTTCSSARSRPPTGTSPRSSTARRPAGSRRSRASGRRSRRRSSPRSATSTASPTSTSCSPTPASTPPSAARGARARTPRPPGTCPRPATATSGPPPTAWPSSASSTTRSSRPTTRASERRARAKMNALGHCMRKALSLVWGVWRNGQDFDPDWGLEA